MVTDVEPQSARVYVRASGAARIEWDGLSWGRRVKNGLRLAMPKTAAEVVTRGDIVYVVTNRRGVALLAQMPDVQGALVALNPQDGSIASLVGGFDYFDNKFNASRRRIASLARDSSRSSTPRRSRTASRPRR